MIFIIIIKMLSQDQLISHLLSFWFVLFPFVQLSFLNWCYLFFFFFLSTISTMFIQLFFLIYYYVALFYISMSDHTLFLIIICKKKNIKFFYLRFRTWKLNLHLIHLHLFENFNFPFPVFRFLLFNFFQWIC